MISIRQKKSWRRDKKRRMKDLERYENRARRIERGLKK